MPLDKKYSKFILAILGLLFSFTFCLQAEEVTDPLLSTYSESQGKYYLWRIRENTYNIEDQTLSKEKLLSTVWVQGISDGFQSSLVFYSDNIFRAGYMQSGWEVEGHYTILNNNEVQLSITDPHNRTISSRLLGNVDSAEYIFKIDSQNFWYQHFIEDESNSIKWFALGSNPKEGQSVRYKNFQVVRRRGRVVSFSNALVYQEPSLTASPYNIVDWISRDTIMSYNIEKPEINIWEALGRLRYLPKGQDFHVIGELENSSDGIVWLLVYLSTYHDMEVGWIPARSVIPYNEDDTTQYVRWKQQDLDEVISEYEREN